MASAPGPFLYYFSGRGLAELIRLILAEAKVSYTEVSVGSWKPGDQPQAFQDLAKSGIAAYNSLPLWQEPNGLHLVQSKAIVQHLARTYGLYGASPVEHALVDMVYEGVNDLTQNVSKYRSAPADDKLAVKKTIFEQDVPKWLGYFERLLKKNETGSGFFVGQQLTFADLAVWYVLERVTDEQIASLDSFPSLKAFKHNIESRPRIKAHRESPTRFPLQRIFA